MRTPAKGSLQPHNRSLTIGASAEVEGRSGVNSLSDGISTFLMSEPKDPFLEQTRCFWQKHTDRPLSVEDARQIAANVTGVFRVLAEWAAAEDRQQTTPAPEGRR
jgi:hypothetical protein